MIRYLDTSALVKRYVPEPGSGAVRALFRRRAQLATVRIAHAELAAAVGRLHRESALSAATRDAVLERIQADFAALDVVEVRVALVRHAASLAVELALRGYDAVHLAGALALRARGLAVDFWSADARLVEAARLQGLRATLPEEA